jgi:hypothetical protein
MITIEQVRAAKWDVMFLDGSGFFERRMRCLPYPRLLVVARGPRGNSKERFGRRFWVDGLECPTLEAAVHALNQPADDPVSQEAS